MQIGVSKTETTLTRTYMYIELEGREIRSAKQRLLTSRTNHDSKSFNQARTHVRVNKKQCTESWRNTTRLIPATCLPPSCTCTKLAATAQRCWLWPGKAGCCWHRKSVAGCRWHQPKAPLLRLELVHSCGDRRFTKRKKKNEFTKPFAKRNHYLTKWQLHDALHNKALGEIY